MTYSLKVSILGFVLALACAAVCHAEDVKVNCVHIGNLTVCTKN